MTRPNYRALCANLTAALNDWQWETGDDRYEGLIARARAALADPDPLEQCIRMDECRVQRGNGNGAPATPKPVITPKPQFPPPRIIIWEDFLP